MVLHVMDMEEVSDKPMRIDSAGLIDVPLAGQVHAAGLTMDQLKAALAAKLARYINTPQISISLTEDQNHPVSIIGSVNSPGVHQLQGQKRLLEVISMAGGIKADAGPKVILTREIKWGPIDLPGARTDSTSRYSTASLSLDDLMKATNPAENIMIEPNDVVSIPKAEVVYVVGDVKKAGGFELSTHETISILQALSLAQGLDHNSAAGKSKIIRPAPGGDGKPHEIPVNITKILAGTNPDVPLFANDVLFVPNSLAKSTARRSAEAILEVATGIVIYHPL